MENIVGTKEVAALYKVSRESVKNWRLKGMPYMQLGPKTFRYDLEQVKEWLQQEIVINSKAKFK